MFSEERALQTTKYLNKQTRYILTYIPNTGFSQFRHSLEVWLKFIYRAKAIKCKIWRADDYVGDIDSATG